MEEETKVDPRTGKEEPAKKLIEDVFKEWQGGSESVNLFYD